MPGHPRSPRPYFQVVLALSAAHRPPAMGQPSLERETSRRGPNASRILKTRFARIFLGPRSETMTMRAHPEHRTAS